MIARYNTQISGCKNFNFEISGIIDNFEVIGFADEKFDIVDEDKKFTRIKARIYDTKNIQHFACIKKQKNKKNSLICFKNIPDNFICVFNCKQDTETMQDI